jgi:quercetin dioxygenase-like cupin family protein
VSVIRGESLQFTDLVSRRVADPLRSLDAQSSVRIVEMERTEGRTAHRHPHSEEVFYVEAGEGDVWIDGSSTRVGPGDVVRIPPGAAHATVPAEGSSMRLVCFFPHPELSSNSEETDIQVS